MIAAFMWWEGLFVLFWLAFIFLTATIARSKGYSPILWGILAVFFPLITS